MTNLVAALLITNAVYGWNPYPDIHEKYTIYYKREINWAAITNRSPWEVMFGGW